MNQHSFIRYVILSSANIEINTVPTEEEEAYFLHNYVSAENITVLSSHCFMGNGYLYWAMIFMSDVVKEFLVSHNKYLNTYTLSHPDKENETQIWSPHLINLISSQILLPLLSCCLTLAGFIFSSLWGICSTGNARQYSLRAI